MMIPERVKDALPPIKRRFSVVTLYFVALFHLTSSSPHGDCSQNSQKQIITAWLFARS